MVDGVRYTVLTLQINPRRKVHQFVLHRHTVVNGHGKLGVLHYRSYHRQSSQSCWSKSETHCPFISYNCLHDWDISRSLPISGYI